MSTVVSGQPATASTAQAGAHPWLNCYPKGVDWAMPFASEPLYALMDRAVANYGTAKATNFLYLSEFVMATMLFVCRRNSFRICTHNLSS